MTQVKREVGSKGETTFPPPSPFFATTSGGDGGGKKVGGWRKSWIDREAVNEKAFRVEGKGERRVVVARREREGGAFKCPIREQKSRRKGEIERERGRETDGGEIRESVGGGAEGRKEAVAAAAIDGENLFLLFLLSPPSV